MAKQAAARLGSAAAFSVCANAMGEEDSLVNEPLSRRGFLRLVGGVLAAWALRGPAGAAAWAVPDVQEGDIPDPERITLEADLPGQISYRVRYLPAESAAYGGLLYQVRPRRIWWHWDGGPTPVAEDPERVQTTWRGLNGRTRRGDPVSAHFSVGPGAVLQMLPMATCTVIQGRLTDDGGVTDVRQAPSLGGIHLETTGRWYFKDPPLESQSAALVDLTIGLLRQYRLPFSSVCGHRERAARNPKPDPGPEYLAETRIRLLRTLIARAEWSLIDPPDAWNFYREVLSGDRIKRVLSQSRTEIEPRLTERERVLVRRHVMGEPAPQEVPGRYLPI